MKYKYSVNSNNRLLIKSSKMKRPVEAKGKFSVDKDNKLTYWLNEPVAWRRIYSLPPKITFKGSWQLNKNYDLELVLDKARRQFQDDILTIKGNIISGDRDLLAFEVKSYDHNGLLHIRILKLAITWLADEQNRLIFIVKKHVPDIIVLGADWQVNKNQQITYTYDKTELKTKTKFSHTITFTGFWQISAANKLTFILKHSSESKFDFRAQIETPNLYPQKGLIKYRLGVGIREQGPARLKIVSLYGAWKFSRKLGLNFQMDYGNGQFQSLEFGTDISLTPRNQISFALKNKEGEPLGINILFTHKFLRHLDAQAFLRLKKVLQRDSAVEAGVRIPF